MPRHSHEWKEAELPKTEPLLMVREPVKLNGQDASLLMDLIRKLVMSIETRQWMTGLLAYGSEEFRDPHVRINRVPVISDK